MNQKHRDAIDSCYEEIVPRIDLKKLWPKLVENKIFDRDDVNVPRWEQSFADQATVRDVYLTIKTRGPFAFDRFLASLRQSDHDNLADALEGKKIPCSNNGTIDEQKNLIEGMQDNFFHNIQSSVDPLQISVKKAVKFLDGPLYENVHTYPMRSKPRGLVLIITNIHYKNSKKEPRHSAALDQENSSKLFEQMGFEVISYFDLTGQDLYQRVKEFSQREDLRKVDSCFVIISSHGNINAQYKLTEIDGVDCDPEMTVPNYKHVLCMDILDLFTAKACENLAQKPKIFIFQLCRGKEEQKSVKEPRHTTDISNFHSSDEMLDPGIKYKNTLRNYADMFVAHATLPGYAAYRDIITGSWFLQIMCEVFMNHAYNTHLQDLLNMVDERLKLQRTSNGECQTLVVTSIGFSKHCYLNPGLFEET